jgi:hypothetical protein
VAEDLSVYPRERLFTNEGALARRAAIYVDGRNVRWLADADLTECLLSGTAKTLLLFPILANWVQFIRSRLPIALQGANRDQFPAFRRCGDCDCALRASVGCLGSRAILDLVRDRELLLADLAVAPETLSGLVYDDAAVVVDHMESERERVSARSGTTLASRAVECLQDHSDFLGFLRSAAGHGSANRSHRR